MSLLWSGLGGLQCFLRPSEVPMHGSLFRVYGIGFGLEIFPVGSQIGTPYSNPVLLPTCSQVSEVPTHISCSQPLVSRQFCGYSKG